MGALADLQGRFEAAGHSYRCTASYQIKGSLLRCGDIVVTDLGNGASYDIAAVTLPADAGGDHAATLLQAVKSQVEAGSAQPRPQPKPASKAAG